MCDPDLVTRLYCRAHLPKHAGDETKSFAGEEGGVGSGGEEGGRGRSSIRVSIRGDSPGEESLVVVVHVLVVIVKAERTTAGGGRLVGLEWGGGARVEVVECDRVVLALVEPVEKVLPWAVLENEKQPVVRLVGL